MKKGIRPMSFSLILIGLCFFCNPTFAAVDILPDFVGALLVALGLVVPARISVHMATAKRAFLRLAYADAAKNLVLVGVFAFGGSNDQATLLLIVAFVSATVLLYFAVCAVRALFDAFEFSASSYGCDALYAVHRKGLSYTELFSKFTVFFLIFREVLCLLPEFAALLNSTYVDSDMIRIYDYIGLMRVMVCIPVALLGAVWLVRLLRYFGRLRSERDFRTALALQYADFIQKRPGIRIKAQHAAAFFFLSVGSFFLVDFYLDFQNIIPDTIGGVLILVGIMLLKLPLRSRLIAATVAALYSGVAAVSSHLSYRFSLDFSIGQVAKSEEAASAYFTMWVTSLAEMLCFLLLLLLLMILLRATVRAWAGYVPEHCEGDFETRSLKNLRDEFDSELIKCYLFGFFSALFSFLFDYLKEWPAHKAFRILEFFWFADFLMAIVFGCILTYLLSLIQTQIKARFQYE
ncbi:MAG: hypothetical protein E7663_00710 [Ruminococcaceae bacterium]|nr:hypothetical protein [Oscillospiraceae bacterium]